MSVDAADPVDPVEEVELLDDVELAEDDVEPPAALVLPIAALLGPTCATITSPGLTEPDPTEAGAIASETARKTALVILFSSVPNLLSPAEMESTAWHSGQRNGSPS